MKITAQREDLLPVLQTVAGVVERKQTSPILSNTLINVENDKLTFTGTDLEVELVTSCPVQSDETGDITLPARKLVDLCRTLPEGAKLEMTVDTDKAVIRSGRSRFTLSALPAVEFPNIEPIDTELKIEIAQKDLKYIIEKTQFAMAQQDVRYYLNGLLFDIQTDKICSVATDGHRLAFASFALTTNIPEPAQIIVPRKGIVELARLLEASEDKIELQIGKNHIRVVLPNVTFTSKLIDGKFPDYSQVIPGESVNPMQVERSHLHQAFNRIAVLSNEKFRGMRVQLQRNLLKATVHNPEQEEAEEEIEAKYGGDEFEIGFNIGYFLDALSVVPGEEVIIHFTDVNHSCLIHALNDQSCKYVIMPMRL